KAWTWSVMSGPGSSAPMSDQVPELRYAHDAPWAGTAATAELVSCVAGAMTGTASRPTSAATDGRNPPSTVPGGTILPKILRGSPNASMSSYAQVRVDGLYIWLVLALLDSLTWTPVKKK